MSPPPPAVEFGSPIETSFKNPTENFSTLFPESVQSHDQRTMDPSSSSSFTASGIGNGVYFGFGAGSGEKTKTRQKPRLVKRKNARKGRGTTNSGEVLSGFNPFAPPSNGLNVNGLNVNDRDDAESESPCFVFGASGNGNSASGGKGNVSVTPSSGEEEFSTPIGCSGFSKDEVLGNDNWKKGLGFDSSCGSGKGTSTTDHNDDREARLSVDMEKLSFSDDRVYGGNEYEDASKSDNVPVFVFGSNSGNVDPGCKEGAGKSVPWSFNSNGFHNATDEKPAETVNMNNSTSTSFDSRTPFGDFKVPQWDASVLKSSLFPEGRKNPVLARRKRLSKDKRSKNVKEKVKQCELNRGDNPASEGIESQEKNKSPGYCSPMDFSPYGGEKASDQFPMESSVTSSDLSHAKDPSVFTAENNASGSMPLFSFEASITEGKIRHSTLPTVKKYRRNYRNRIPKKNPSATMQNNQENQHVNTSQAKQESGSTSGMPDICEVWRLRGNQAYRNGDMCKAEDCYTRGINSSPASGSPEYSMKPLALCYGNRAAARISRGRLREAISDCEMAASLDPSYIKAYMRAANCYLVLGELGTAMQFFNKCMESASSVCLDRRTTIESAEGLQQAQRVADYTNRASILLEKRTPDGASEALGPIGNALSISSCSDKLFQMKAEGLLMIRRYKEVIELCENTLEMAERNFVSAGVDGVGSKHHSLIVWRWNMISKSHFYLGNLETSLDILEKLQQLGSSRNENQEECHDVPASLAATISELLRYKNAGNEAVRAGKYMEAVEQYTAALSRNVDSRPFAAICFCNRAAANQALVQIADAIADCSLAMALDENYSKAVSRRATLHELIRDYDQAASDLQRLITILVKQSDEKTKSAEASADRASSRKELKQARQRLSSMEAKSKEGTTLDFFLILGVKTSDTAADIKKAYRKAALRHHPDKAAQILVRSESEGPWLKEILEEVHKGADRLFKMIGEAYSVLSDPTKRSDYELEEDIRKAKAYRESYRSRENGRTTESSSSPYQTSWSRRYWKESGRTSRSSSSSWW